MARPLPPEPGVRFLLAAVVELVAAPHNWEDALDLVEAAHDVDTFKLLDSENLLSISLGCWDCEQPLGAIQPGSKCPAGDEWTQRP